MKTVRTRLVGLLLLGSLGRLMGCSARFAADPFGEILSKEDFSNLMALLLSTARK